MSGRLFLGGLSSRATERDVKDFFKGYGEIVNISIKNGYGFVELADARDAEDAIHDLNRKELCGSRVVVEASNRRSGSRGGKYDGDRSYQGGRSFDRPTNSRFPPPVSTNYRLIVENLSSRCSWQDLKDMVRSCAEATYADAHKQERNTGLLCFASHSDLKRVMKKFQGEEINGRNIKLIDDTRASSRSRSRSRSGSRSPPRDRRRSRSRSKSRSRSPPRNRRRSRSRSNSRSRSPPRDRRRSRSRSQSRSRSSPPRRSRSPPPRRSRSSPPRLSRSLSRSRSPRSKNRKRSPSNSRSHSPPTEGRGGSRSRSSENGRR